MKHSRNIHTASSAGWTRPPVSALWQPVPARPSRRVVAWFSQHWLLVFVVVWGISIGLPWLAPVLMQAGWTRAGTAIYTIYASQCHQLPQRSFFVFGPKLMYTLPEIQAVWQPTTDAVVLRQFVGNAEMGWKVAWSDRMVSLYGSMWLAGIGYALLRRRFRPLPWWAFALLALPMVLDGSTHLLSDLAGIGTGFRDTNTWLASLTGTTLPSSFRAGDALGSFNSWARLTTGMLFGAGVVWLVFPHLDHTLREIAHSRITK